MFVFNREDVTTMGIAQAVITAIDITAAVVDLTRVDALTNRTVLARSAVQSTRTSTMDTVEASSNREDGVHGREWVRFWYNLSLIETFFMSLKMYCPIRRRFEKKSIPLRTKVISLE